jgi:hypothetical protein
MPRTSYGQQKLEQSWKLLAALLQAKSNSTSDSITVENVTITYCNWRGTETPSLDVKATLNALAALSSLLPEQVRESLTLHLGEKFLKILEDKRSQKAGRNAENWIFVLQLWSTNLDENQRQFEDLWQLRKSGKRPQRSLTHSGSDPIEELVQQVRSLCCSKILITCNHIQLYTLNKIDLDKLYVPVFVSQEPSDQRESNQKNPPPSPALETVNNHQHLIIFGKPGAGKSTFSSHLAITCCNKDSQADWIPVLLRLSDLDTRTQFKLLELLRVAFDRDQSITQQILKSGKVFLILDGLDEISSQVRQEICQEITNFITDYHKNKIVITCRSEFKDYKLHSVFDRVKISDFDELQQNRFIENWFSIANNESTSWLATRLKERPECNSQKLINHLLSNNRLQELAKTPILLSLICLVYVSDGVLPKKRSLLYERGLDILLEQWDDNRRVENRIQSNVYKTLSSGDKQKILSELARYKFEQTEDVLAFEQAKALKVIAQYRNLSDQESLQILEGIAADHGLLFQSARKKWQFSHLTFQEYFVAKWFVQHKDWQKLVHNLFNPLWREVFLLTTEMLPSADDLLLLMKQQIDELMAGDEKLQRFLTWVDAQEFSRYEDPTQKTQILSKPKPCLIRSLYLGHLLESFQDIELIESFNKYQQADKNWLSFTELIIESLEQDSFNYAELALATNPGLAEIPINDFPFNYEEFLKLGYISDFQIKLSRLMERAKNPEMSLSKYSCSSNQQKLLTKAIISALGFQKNYQGFQQEFESLKIEYQRFRNEWQSVYEKRSILRKYYDANKLLVDCLNSDCYISRSVREEIEATLFLPINN